ncbi:MAG: c-type cytochrome [Bacteroidota bacterium]
MKKVLRIAGYVIGAVGVIIVCLVAYLNFAFPKVSSPQSLTVEATPARLERGAYLVNHVVGCIDCHSTRDWTKFAGPIIPGTEGKGGEKFDKATANFPGTIYAKNITPFNLKNWSDGELYRLITSGVTKDGKAIFPLMPYPAYAKMDPEDVKAVIAYLRTLPEVPSEAYPESQLDFPLNLIVKTIPKDAADPMIIPSKKDTMAYGKYLVTIAACTDCHTPMDDKGGRLPGMDFAGGMEFQNPLTGDVVRSANITQSIETGIGGWTEEIFVEMFTQYRDSVSRNKNVNAGELNTAMPWMLFSGLKDDDIIAIYRFLKTVPPVEHRVEKFTPRTISAH